MAQVAVEFDDDVAAPLLFLLTLRADFGASFCKAARVSWLSLCRFPRDMHTAEIPDFIGAPEENSNS